MAYNKAREERKWKKWKEREERQLRIMGMDEDSIQELRSDDWRRFNSERRFRERQAMFPDNPEWEAPNSHEQEVTKVSDLLDCVSDERLFNVLFNSDKRTLQFLLLKMMGFSGREISEKTGISENTINTKFKTLRKKLKKFD